MLLIRKAVSGRAKECKNPQLDIRLISVSCVIIWSNHPSCFLAVPSAYGTCQSPGSCYSELGCLSAIFDQPATWLLMAVIAFCLGAYWWFLCHYDQSPYAIPKELVS